MSILNIYKQKPILFCLVFLALVWSSHSGAAPLYRPERPQREINTDEYKLIVQKNNRIDILLLSGQHVLDDFYPAVQFADGARKPIQIHHRQSVRTAVRNPLGQGNGFQFRSRDGDWQIATYPTQPFLTIDFSSTTPASPSMWRACPPRCGQGRFALPRQGRADTGVLSAGWRSALRDDCLAHPHRARGIWRRTTKQRAKRGGKLSAHSGAGRGEVRLAAVREWPRANLTSLPPIQSSIRR